MMRWAGWIARWRWPVAIALAAGCAALAWQARHLSIDPSNSALIIREGAAYQSYERVRKRYGSDRTIVVGIELHEGLTPSIAFWLTDLTSELQTLPHAEAVRSLASLEGLRQDSWGRIEKELLLEDEASVRRLAAQGANPAHAWPPGTQLLLSEDRRMTAVVIRAAGSDLDREYQHALIETVRRVLDVRARPDATFLLTGTSVVQDTVVDRIRQDRQRFIPMTIGVIALGLLVLCVRWRTLFYALAVMGGTLLSVEGIMALWGTPINVVTSLLAPVILIVAVGSTVHLSNYAADVSGPRGQAARVAAVYQAMFMPCLLAALTTAVGFLALLVSHIPAVREFGGFGALGAGIAWVLSMGWLPVFVAGSGKEGGIPLRKLLRAFGAVLSKWTRRHRVMILTLAIAGVAAALWAAPNVRISTNLLHVLKPQDAFRLETERVQEALGGIYPIDILLESPDEESLHRPEGWRRLEQFEQAIGRHSMVARTIGPTDLMNYLEHVTGQKRSKTWLDRVFARLQESDAAPVRELFGSDLRHLRWMALLNSSDTAGVIALGAWLHQLSKAILPEGWKIEVTGTVLLLAQMSQQLVHAELASVALAFPAIFLIAWIATRSLSYAMISLLPNLVPIAGLFGLMAVWHIPLTTATALIASVALGLVFDNTIHEIYRYREARLRGLGAAQAVRWALQRCTHPILITSLILAGGFSVTLWGRLLPMVHFGLLTCTVIGLALAGDLLVLPALLAFGARKR